MTQPSETLAQAREEFLALVADVRPELHRYCARLTGSVIDGEDIVQDALAKAFYALSMNSELPQLRPWLFRVAHNSAIDFLRRHDRKYTEARDDLDETIAYEERTDPSVVRAALGHFLPLPVLQRSAVILKDVLGHSLEEVAETMSTTIPAVKAALVRGRAGLSASQTDMTDADAATREKLQHYARLFNLRDWDGVRALVSDECALDLVSKSRRRGKAVGDYFGRYAKQNISLGVVRLEQRLALAAFVDNSALPAYFILLTWDDYEISNIRDFRYVPYIAHEAEFEPIDASE
jgi:RNA polymerase sigma-70 factor (ECF subfamily)